jgi:DNA-binding transcriptional LysR family regulator
MDRLDSRALRYFIAVAEELHFGRAADRLGIAQPPLSRAIRQLESRLGVPLLQRTSRAVRLTPAGQVLLDEGQPALQALDATARRVQRAGQPQPVLAVALKADNDGGLLPAVLAAYRREQAAIPVEVVLGGWGEQAGMLRDGRADVALVYEPYDHRGLDSETLLTEHRVAALPAGHRLAGRTIVRMTDLAGEPLPGQTGPAPGGHRQPGPRDLAQLLRLVELGELVMLIPESVAARYPRPELAYRPVTDASPAILTVAWPRASRSLATAAFARAAAVIAARACDRAAIASI